MRYRILGVGGLIILLFACAPVISKQGLREVDPEITFTKLLQDPESHRGKLVLLGGQILATTVREGETWMEVLQQPLDWEKKPKDTDVTQGRFLIRFAEFRDPAIYAAGRKVTILGEVQGKKLQSFKDIEYVYPVLVPREFHLWKPETKGGPFFHIGIGVGGVIR